MARRTGSEASPAKKRRHSLGAVRASPRRRQSRLSLPTPSAARALSDSSGNDSSSSESEASAERHRTSPITRQSTPASSGTKSAASSRRRHPVSSLQTLADSLGRSPAASASAAAAAEKEEEEGEGEPENEPPSAQDAGRKLRFGEEESDAVTPVELEVGESSTAAAESESESRAADGAEEEEPAPAVELPAGARLRRRTRFWTEEEEERLRRGVQKFGAGKWKLILEDGRGVFSSHRTNIDLKDKWKNLLSRGERTRGRQLSRACASPQPADTEAPTADAVAEEIDSSDEDARRPTRPTKKRRTAAEVATASFAAVRTAELSQSQSQSQSQDEEDELGEETPAPAYTATMFSPHADHSYEVEVVSYNDSEAEGAYAAASASAERAAASSEKKPARSKTSSVSQELPSGDQSRDGVRTKANSAQATSTTRETDTTAVAVATTSVRTSSAARISPIQIMKTSPVRGGKATDAAASRHSLEQATTKKTRKSAPRVVEFEFVTDATFPEATSLKVDLANCQDVGMLKGLLRGDLLPDAPAAAAVQVVSISSRCLVNDDEATDACIEKHGRAFYLLF